MALRAGTHDVGPENGTLRVNTYREGMAQKIGHDLILDVGKWKATVEVGQDGTPSTIGLEADPRSLSVHDALHGAKPLSDKDRADIVKGIDEKVLGGQPITFQSSAVEHNGAQMSVDGELSMAGSTKPATFKLDVADDGRVSGTLPLTQSHWGIKPYKAFMGALKVSDRVEIVLDVRLAAA